MGNHFQLSSQELHLESIKLGNRLYVPSLQQVYFSLTSISQNVSRTQVCTEVCGVPCPQINNSKLCKFRQISNRKFKAVKELYLGRKLPVHAMPGLCTVNVLDYEISLSCEKFRKHHREPLFGHGNISVGAYLWLVSLLGALLNPRIFG